jgi:hypothetical protein
MASSSLLNRIMAFLRSPRGRRLVDQGRRNLNRPGTQSKVRALLARLGGRRR